jgi:hypothetical protein
MPLDFPARGRRQQTGATAGGGEAHRSARGGAGTDSSGAGRARESRQSLKRRGYE